MTALPEKANRVALKPAAFIPDWLVSQIILPLRPGTQALRLTGQSAPLLWPLSAILAGCAAQRRKCWSSAWHT